MQTSNPLDSYLASELESERCKLIPEITLQKAPSGTVGLEIWTVLSMLPSRLERVQVASTLRVSEKPSPDWSICSHLLQDAEQDVVGNAINAMTRAQVRSFAHRAFHYLRSPERPQRILYCLARYCEEAHDSRIAEQLAPTLASDLSDAYLARSFNALYRHGIKSESALNVAFELVSSHIDATNMDRKAAVAAITYLFFAGNSERIAGLKNIHDRVTIPELRRLLNWGFRNLSLLSAGGSENFQSLSSESFWKENFSPLEPNYTGYGCFEPRALLEGLKAFEKSGNLPSIETLTERVLKLGDRSCIEWLASHQRFGISELLPTSGNESILKLWRHYCPPGIAGFNSSVLNPKNAAAWHQESPELLVIHLSKCELSEFTNALLHWIEHAKNCESQLSLNIYLGLVLAVENRILNFDENQNQFDKSISNITQELKILVKSKNDDDKSIRNAALAGLIGTPLEMHTLSSFLRETLHDINWADLAYSHFRFDKDQYVLSLLERFEMEARERNAKPADDKMLLMLARTTSLAILNTGLENEIQAIKKVLAFSELTRVLDPNNNVAALSGDTGEDNPDGEETDQGAADWSGHTVIDRPIARWGSIIRALLMQSTQSDDADSASDQFAMETQLKESMRTAKHVEKRWIARALAQLGSDEAVKTLLYQGLQHIDSEFVSHTIRELLPSPHPRAQQALIRCVGRNAISDDLKLNILEDISIHNPNEILQELKTLEILRLPQHIDDAVRDAVGRVAALLDEKDNSGSEVLEKKIVRMDGQDVDSTIRSLLSNSELLNVDARSALRTAEMILLQSRGWTQGGMDLSPIVNMHCKAVELVLRDTFEPHTDALLRKGQLSRKLDILGYARPIPEKMQIFEDFLANLPVVKTIPYFSKFKLRKMLRGICLFRPGKRFTLDGPKAFALFFLVTSRQSCSFGLEKMLPLGMASDVELFEYIKLIHSLQDSRNRAVHEGLTWEAKDEIESMRAQAFKVIEISLKLKKYIAQNDGTRGQSNASGLGLGA